MKRVDTALLYYLSGTGNTYRVARWLKKHFEENEIETRLSSIEHADYNTDFQDSIRQLTVLLFPTHGFMPPWSMIKFLFRMPRQKNGQALITATRGAIWIGPVKIPGAAGFAHFFAALVLLVKGYAIRGLFSLDMPSNFINVHPGLHRDTVKRISDKARKRLGSFLEPVLSGRRLLFTLNNLYESIWTVGLFWLLPIFPILYLIYAKTSMAKMMFSNNRCISCGLCARVCPNGAIEMKRLFGKKRPFWTYHCENCMRCMGYCAKKAVEAGHGLAGFQYLFISTMVTAGILSWAADYTGVFSELSNHWSMVLFEAIYYIPALLLSYWIIWVLMAIPAVRTFFSVTTLTHYFRRYHEPDTRIRDLINKCGK